MRDLYQRHIVAVGFKPTHLMPGRRHCEVHTANLRCIDHKAAAIWRRSLLKSQARVNRHTIKVAPNSDEEIACTKHDALDCLALVDPPHLGHSV